MDHPHYSDQKQRRDGVHVVLVDADHVIVVQGAERLAGGFSAVMGEGGDDVLDADGPAPMPSS
jgi:hypothetical protein